MKLFYGRKVLVDLGIRNITEYGFDTFQIGPFYSGGTISKFNEIMEGVKENEDDGVDEFFVPNANFLIALGFSGRGGHGTNEHVYPNGHPGSNPINGIGSIERECWHDNPNHAFYTSFRTLFNAISEEYESRFKGVRWNHEIQPWRFKLGSAWETYANEHCASAWAGCQGEDGSQVWGNWLRGLALGTLEENEAYEGTAGSPWNGSEYQNCRTVYRHLVNFQCQVQKKVIGHLSNKIQSVSSSLKFMVYPPQYYSPTYAHSEYTLDLDGYRKPNIIWELGTRDLIAHTDDLRNVWADKAASQETPQDYYFVLQQMNPFPSDPTHPDSLTKRLERLEVTLDNMRNPETSPDTAAWQDSLAFWNRWRPDGPPPWNDWTKEQQREYMNKLKCILT